MATKKGKLNVKCVIWFVFKRQAFKPFVSRNDAKLLNTYFLCSLELVFYLNRCIIRKVFDFAPLRETTTCR